MKNRKFLLVMLVMALTFGLTMLGCDNGGGENDKEEESGGTITLTGIPDEFNGKYAIFYAEDDDSDLILVGAQTFNLNGDDMSGTAVQILDGSVSLPMWTATKNGTATRYSGNDTVVDAMIVIFNSASVSSSGDEPINGRYFDSITFSNGSASKTWAEGQEGGLEGEEGEDVDVNDNVITIGNWKYQANDDSGDNGTSTITMTQGTGADSGKLTFSGVLNEGCEYGPFCNILITPNETELEKLKTATSISFKVKGDGATYQLQLPTSDITDWSYYKTTFTASTTETTVNINISDLSGPGWGQSETTPLDMSKALYIVIQTELTTVGTHFELTISDLTLDNDD